MIADQRTVTSECLAHDEVPHGERSFVNDANLVTTSDPDQIERLVSEVIAPHNLQGEFGRGGLRAEFSSVTLPDVTLGYLTYGQSVSLEIPRDALTDLHINIPLTGSARTLFRREIVDASPFVGALYNPGDAAMIAWGQSCSQLCIKYSTSTLDRELQKLLNRPVDTPLEFKHGVNVESPSGRQWLSTVKLINHSTSLLEHPVLSRRLQQLVIDGLLFGQAHNYTDDLRSVVTRHTREHPKAVQRVVDFIESDPTAVAGVGDLARIAGLSVRALQLAFQQSLDVSPMAYARDARLRGAHERLRRAPIGSLTVSQVAHDWGFLNPGRFSALYTAKFGESPSETLRGFG
ncbi:AraC family transcriptional regulator [Pseudarthrobacter sp. H3Y2-7]|uniref:AraC family transcriptional regulator n=1 Tax=Pseudarthrobacter naphthalenicus TaxID=3031328 RepID=UPI0023B13B78|nr:AraC family transcriptional regulator [Pseudarthrobacter sp. H3Y2-7]MDE8670909.1 AraC family transcriptional regulator [Pseudarthrobacter sp. H3Y2-7]